MLSSPTQFFIIVIRVLQIHSKNCCKNLALLQKPGIPEKCGEEVTLIPNK